MAQPLINLVLTLTVVGVVAGWHNPTQGQPPDPDPDITLLTCPSDISQPLPAPPLSQEQLSLPSLWLTKEQFGGKLLSHWFIDPQNPGWAILIVNRQMWGLLDYLERYQFVNYFGTIASQYHYNIQVCNRQKTLPVALYTCEFNTTPITCKVDLGINNPGLRAK